MVDNAIVDEIERELQPLKRGVHRPRERIRAGLKIVIEGNKHLAPRLRTWRAARERAARIEPDVNKLRGSLRPEVIGEVAALAHIEGPDPRMDVLQWLVAHQAWALLEELWTRPATSGAAAKYTASAR